MTLGQPIGRGRTAEIFAWEDGRIVKLFHDWVRPEYVQSEARNGELLHAAGLPTPAVEGVIERDGRHGIVMERIEGASLLRHVVDNPWSAARLARRMAGLHAQIHTVDGAGLPSLKERLLARIEQSDHLPDSARTAALAALEKLPDATTACHGDFHPDNILLVEDRAYIIDWSEAAHGHPLADVARTSLMVSLGEPPPDADESLRWRLNQVRGPFHDDYLERYMQLSDSTQEQIHAWQLPITCARLALHIPEEEGRVVGRIEWLT